MRSIILTKINKVSLPFKDQVTELKGEGDINFLTSFIMHSHRNADTEVKPGNSIEVVTSKGHYLYGIFPNYIRKINLNTQCRSFYKIS